MPPRIPFIIGMVALFLVQISDARRPRVKLPMPTSETIPYVAEVMGATSYEESVEEGGEVKRVQRKLSGPEHKEPDLDKEEEFAEYQGVIGRPGVDFPVLPSIPRTEFSCRNVKSSGYYADLETGCQVFHICDGGRKISFLCPNGTIFRQSHLICDWWFRVDCERSVELYEESAEQLAHDQMIYKKRAEEIAKAITVRTTSEAPRVASNTQQRQYRRKPQQRTQSQPQQRTQSQIQPRTQSQFQPRAQPRPQSQYQPQATTQQSQYQHQAVTQQPQYQPQAVTQQPQYQPQAVTQQQPQYQHQAITQQPLYQPQAVTTKQPQYQPQAVTQQPQYQPQAVTQQPQYQPQAVTQQQSQFQPQAVTQQPQYQPQAVTQQQPQYQPQVVTQQQPQYQPQAVSQQIQYQQPKTQQPQYQPQSQNQPELEPQQEEQERQIPAETASFASNRHRFANQLEEQYKQYTATTTTTTAPPSTLKSLYNYNGRRYQTTSSTTVRYNPPSFQEISNNEEHINEEFGKEELRNEEIINKNYPGGVYASYNYTYHNADYYNSNHNYTNNYNFSSSDYDNSYSQQNGQYYQPETNRGTSKYIDNSQVNQKAILEPKSSHVLETLHPSTTTRSISNSEFNFYNDQIQRKDNYQQIHPSTRSPLKQKTVFDVKIRPTKDFAYVELLRHEEYMKNQSKTTAAPLPYSSSTPSQKTSYETTPLSLSDDAIPVSRFSTSTPSSQPSTRHTYLPTKATETTKKYTTTATPKINRYASVHVSGSSQEIRPEVVNSLMESGVTPTSAKALHSLASYISSADAEDLSSIYGQPDGHPQVSDVILKFHSGTPATNSYIENEITTRSYSSPPDEILPAGLTKATKESYSYLFSESKEQTEKKGEVPNVPLLEIDYTTQKPQTTTSQTTKGGDRDLRLKDSSELRELAQVFSRALSAYLEDPETFKEILAQVRPTEPSNIDHTTPSPEDEVLDFSDANQGQKGSTNSPLTTLSNFAGYTDESLSIGDINNLVQASRTFEPDNSLEHNTFPPTAPENYQASRFSLVTPSSIESKVNSITNNTEPLDYYSRLGSKEDLSYFPTVGGVSDTSRPRYGGFQNNTQKTARAYSPYGSDVPKNLTGQPIYITTPVALTDVPQSISVTNATSEKEGLPEPKDVNSLIKINVLNSDQSSSEESVNYQTSPSAYQDDTYFPSGDQEKVLITAGSQSLVSSNNYLQFAKKFNEQSQKERSKYYPALYSSNSYINYAPSAESQEKFNVKEDYKSEEFIPFFGQEPPFENLAKPSGFQTTKEFDDVKQDQKLTVLSDSDEKSTGIFADPINYHIGTINAELSTPSYSDKNSEYKVSYKNVDLGNGVTLEKLDSSTETHRFETTWTVSPLIDLTTASGSTLHHNYTDSPAPSSSAHYSSPNQYEATTYRPPRSSDSSDAAEFQWTTVQTENNSEETVTTSGLTDSTETVIPNEHLGSFERTAMDMFGNLNESAAVTLMDMMSKAEKNMTIRRLVLLLVNEKGKENRTIQESRENLINALLNNVEDIKNETTTSELPPLLASPSTPNSVYIPRKKVRVSRVRVSTTSEAPQSSGKFYRGTDTMTAVHGSPSDINKINSAKLYIPSPTLSAYTNTLPIDSDARAVELLRTLYSLAAKWG